MAPRTAACRAGTGRSAASAARSGRLPGNRPDACPRWALRKGRWICAWHASHGRVSRTGPARPRATVSVRDSLTARRRPRPVRGLLLLYKSLIQLDFLPAKKAGTDSAQ
ncbi:hypothetical protein L1887_47393 [Cichorium endivia]|nr:hypothetical protein L1887_62877 [Cichorium endivia]KAI3475678.1 hypothetical protein L1887_62896 [Cichorium endivia]KAI3488622.1 hypothetical protein L1887_47393 [Cichorium endivia]